MIQTKVSDELAIQPLQKGILLTHEEIKDLPKPVQKYLIYTGAIGKVKPQNVRIEFDAKMYRKPGDAPMKSHSCQYNFFGNYSRFFIIKASKAGIPFLAKHIYQNQQATFKVRIAGLFNVVDVKGEELSKAETVTLLNDMCIFAPGCLTDQRLTWLEIDDLSAEVTLKNGHIIVSAKLLFNEVGQLINFVSDDRSALQDNGELKRFRWTTPITSYQEFEGRRIPTLGKTIWHYPDGEFIYGEFELKKIEYDKTN
ncbi:MAG: DUF6544 family protein [Bacteroidales bacterium]